MKSVFFALAILIWLAAPGVGATGEIKTIELVDLQLDIKEMSGQTVRVTGIVQVMGEMVGMKSGPLEMSVIWIETSKLSRDDRKKLLTSCSGFCKVTLVGRVKKGIFGQEGLEAVTLDSVTGVSFNPF